MAQRPAVRRRGPRRATVAIDAATNISPLYKTRPCSFFATGCRSGKNCPFAHGDEELRYSPDFERTSVCPELLNAGECKDPLCRYAHRADELRTTPGLLKTQMCRFFLRGHCVVGEACRFAHRKEELQNAATLLQRTRSTPSSANTDGDLDKQHTSLWEQRRIAFGNAGGDVFGKAGGNAGGDHTEAVYQCKEDFGRVPASQTEAMAAPHSDDSSGVQVHATHFGGEAVQRRCSL